MKAWKITLHNQESNYSCSHLVFSKDRLLAERKASVMASETLGHPINEFVVTHTQEVCAPVRTYTHTDKG